MLHETNFDYELKDYLFLSDIINLFDTKNKNGLRNRLLLIEFSLVSIIFG